MVGLSSNPDEGAKLLRKACRVATQLSADWYAVHIETPAESVKKIRTGDFVALLDNINLASDLGAETVWLKAPDPVKGMLDYARDNGISKIIVGRSHQPRWRRRCIATSPRESSRARRISTLKFWATTAVTEK